MIKAQTVYTEVENITEWKVQRKTNNALTRVQWSFVEKHENQITMSKDQFEQIVKEAITWGANEVLSLSKWPTDEKMNVYISTL